jgi:hypothetical protein
MTDSGANCSSPWVPAKFEEGVDAERYLLRLYQQVNLMPPRLYSSPADFTWSSDSSWSCRLPPCRSLGSSFVAPAALHQFPNYAVPTLSLATK